MSWVVEAVATACVFAAALPIASGLYQYVLAAFSQFSTHLEKCSQQYPRLAVVIPAWNEGAVIGATIERLMALDYPPDRLRVYVVDDASTDETPAIVIAQSKIYRDRVYHIRRVAGGEGKAHTLNYGLEALWRSDWTEAVLIMDADVIYTKDSVKKMVRHLADDSIGSVTAYIKEGSRNPNYVQRFVTFEYITATGGSRRAQNVLSFLACLSGGAQLHSRANLMAIGGQIFSHTLAEDTFTTFRTQLSGAQGDLRAERYRLRRGTRFSDRALEAASPVGTGQRSDHSGIQETMVQSAAPSDDGIRVDGHYLVFHFLDAGFPDLCGRVTDHPLLYRRGICMDAL